MSTLDYRGNTLFPRIRHIHFVGIGGIGMSGIAFVLRDLGYEISGSDLALSSTTRRLESLGVKVYLGHNASQIAGAHVVVVSSAVRLDNPEIEAAQRLGIPVIPRAEMLAELMRMKHGLAVAGAHGKTTTTSMLAACLSSAGLDPTVVIGGKVNQLASNARVGQGPYLVAEADESDGTFLKLTPSIAVVTNIDPEHMDYYGTLDRLRQAFVQFANRIPFYGTAVLCLDDPQVRKMIPEVRRPVVTYGFSTQADFRADSVVHSGLESRFVAWHRDSELGAVTLRMPGRHNVLNALAAIAASTELEIPFSTIKGALRDFAGVQRRFQRKGEADGVLVFDDYGHHPTEIRATLAAARASFPERRLVVLFQPHRYSRTQALLEEFFDAFHDAHLLVVTGIYAASEAPIEGISCERLHAGIRERGHRQVMCVPDKAQLLEEVTPKLRAGDLLLTLGAGDIWKVGEAFLTARGGAVEGSQA